MLDVVGSTSMWEFDGVTASQAIARLEVLVAETASENAGVVHKSRGEGDSFFLTFDEPSDAVLGAADLHRKLTSEAWPTRDPIRVRMAIRTGSCERRDGDLFGPTVNRCARMRGAAYPEQIVACEATRSLARAGDAIHFVELGTYHLRDAPAPERFYGLAIDGEVPKSTRLTLGENELHNLPTRATGFIGRESELAAIETALRASKLVTLTGPGGCGKTRLSEVAADRFVGEFSDGVWFVALADCMAAESAAGAIAKAIPNVKLGEPTWDALISGLKSKHVLLALDNCEQLVPALTPFVHRLILECPRLRILATSRKPFNLNEEAVVPVSPFSVEELDEKIEDLENQPAFALFWSRAKSKNPALRLEPATALAIIAICQRLSGIPLALEQAASYSGRLSPVQIEERLRGKLSMLKAAPGTVDARHETMRATIEWSIGLLSADARALISQLAVFCGGWTLEAAEAIAGDQIDAFEAHGELVDSSLVYWVDDAAAGRRYRFLEPIREYVVEMDRVEIETHARFLDWILEFAERVDRELVGGDQAEWTRRAEFELENFRSALDMMLMASDSRLSVLANHLKRLWFRTGLYREGARWLENGLALLEVGELQTRATMLNALGACISRFGDRSLAEERYEESLAVWQKLGIKAQMAGVLTNMAILAADRSEFQKARELYDRSAQLTAESGDERGLGIALMNRSYMEILQEDWVAARTTTEDAIELLRRTKDQQNLAFALGNQAHALWELGEIEAYSRCLREQLDVIEQLHDPYPLGLALASIAVNGSESAHTDVARKALAVLDGLRGFEVSGLGRKTQTRLEEARLSLANAATQNAIDFEMEAPEFQQSYEFARNVLDEFLAATCGNQPNARY